MSTSTVIEVGDEQVGVVVRQTRGVQFFAACRSTGRLEGRVFPNPAAATRAAAALLAGHATHGPGRIRPGRSKARGSTHVL